MKSSARLWVVALSLIVAAGCGSSAAPQSGQDAAGIDGAADAGGVGAPDKPSADSTSSPADASPDAPSSDDAAPDAMTPKACRQDAGRDLSVPPSCFSFDDTDYDGVRDCVDGCPYDSLKVEPGVCGCNRSDIDSDGDGLADCLDRCPHDPNNAGYGECGCVGESGLKPAGTPCTDTACPQPGATCNGAGVCGDRALCSPCPDGHFVFSEESQTAFWFCGASLPAALSPSCVLESSAGGPTVTRAVAQSMCAAKGLTLSRIQSLDENTFVARLVTAPTWIGANALATPGQWYWSSPASDSETLFWMGGADGARVGTPFVNWGKGAPAASSCASISPVDGHWYDSDCSRTLAYVCQYLRHF